MLVEKKMFLQFDDDMPAQRVNALEMLREHLTKGRPQVPRSRRRSRKRDAAGQGRRAGIEAGRIHQGQCDGGRSAMQRNGREIATLKAALWVKVNWKISGAVAAGLLVVVTGYWSL